MYNDKMTGTASWLEIPAQPLRSGTAEEAQKELTPEEKQREELRQKVIALLEHGNTEW